MTGIPDPTAMQRWIDLGRLIERYSLQERLAEANATWVPTERTSWNVQVDRRITQFESDARQFAQRMGFTYREWRGGTADQAASWCRAYDTAAYDPAYT